MAKRGRPPLDPDGSAELRVRVPQAVDVRARFDAMLPKDRDGLLDLVTDGAAHAGGCRLKSCTCCRLAAALLKLVVDPDWLKAGSPPPAPAAPDSATGGGRRVDRSHGRLS